LKIQTIENKTNEKKNYGPFGWPDTKYEGNTFTIKFSEDWAEKCLISPNSNFLVGFKDEKILPSRPQPPETDFLQRIKAFETEMIRLNERKKQSSNRRGPSKTVNLKEMIFGKKK